MTGPIDRILLISPHYTSQRGYKIDLAPPLGIAYVGAVLEQEGYNVRLLDVAAEDFFHRELLPGGFLRAGLTYDAIRERIADFKPDVVGVSCPLSSMFGDMCRIAELAKKTLGNVVTVVGGEHPSALSLIHI